MDRKEEYKIENLTMLQILYLIELNKLEKKKGAVRMIAAKCGVNDGVIDAKLILMVNLVVLFGFHPIQVRWQDITQCHTYQNDSQQDPDQPSIRILFLHVSLPFC